MVDWATISTSVVLSGIVSLIVSLLAFEYKQKRLQTFENQNEKDEWYSRAASLASEAQNTWEGHL